MIPGEHLEGFRSAINSLKLTQRSELMDPETNASLIRELYVDPLPDNGILQVLLAPSTTLLIGRKGTGKSTIFQRLRHHREAKKTICAYIDIKDVFDHAEGEELPKILSALNDPTLDIAFARQLLLANAFIRLVLKNLIEELRVRASESIIEEIRKALFGTKKKEKEAFEALLNMNKYVTVLDISKLRVASKEVMEGSERNVTTGVGGGIRVSSDLSARASLQYGTAMIARAGVVTTVGETLLRQFSFGAFVSDLRKVLEVYGITKVFLLIDDFSELPQDAMELVVKKIIAPLNNSSDGFINFKIAVYPGRIYLGDIDRTRIEEKRLDAFQLYGAGRSAVQMEERAIEFIKRLLKKRVSHYCRVPIEYFFVDSVEEVWEALYYATMANPRAIGYVLSYAIQDLKGRIGVSAIKEAAERYYIEKVETFFFTGRFSDRSLTEKISPTNLKWLLEAIVERAVSLKKYDESDMFKKIEGVVPTSHFFVQRTLEDTFATLELNGFVSRYSEGRDKGGRDDGGRDTITFALNYGLCHKMNIGFGRPPGGQFRQFFRERVFDYSGLVTKFLAGNGQIRCPCGHVEPRESLEFLLRYDMLCPSCRSAQMVVGEKPGSESEERGVAELRLPETELRIMSVLAAHEGEMTASEIAMELDCSSTRAGRTASGLVKRGLVERVQRRGKSSYSLTATARALYFDESKRDAVTIVVKVEKPERRESAAAQARNAASISGTPAAPRRRA
jgi:predicted transcriptional regulator